MSRLNELIPVVARENGELMSIYQIQKEELEKLEASARYIFKNLFLETADEEGVKEYEKILNVVGSGSLTTRKNFILLRLGSRPPYTEAALRRLCNAIYGEGKYGFTVYGDTCAIVFHAYVDNPEDFISFNRELRAIVPANILMIYVIQYMYLWLNENMTYEELTVNEKYTYEELSRYSSVYVNINDTVGYILEMIVKYAYYWLSHNITYRELSENSLYTYAELSRHWLVEFLYSWLGVNLSYGQTGQLTYEELSRFSSDHI